MTTGQTDSPHYVMISSDGHAGAALWDYRPYLAQQYRDEFDVWAEGFTEPWADYDDELADLDDDNIRIGVASAGSSYNWDSAKRLEHLDGEGIAAEVLFPNTVPPFYPSSAITSPSPATPDGEYRHRWAGVQAHNRWMVAFCAQAPGRRAGLAQVFLADLDDAIAEVRWAKEAGLSGILVPSDHALNLVNLYERRLDPFWAACCDAGLPVIRHAIAVGPPETPESGPAAIAVGAYETGLLFRRGLGHLMLGGVFERFPDLQFAFTETGAVWIADELPALDGAVRMGSVKGTTAYPLFHRAVEGLTRSPSEYFRRNCRVGISLAVDADIETRHRLGADRLMWGIDYPHHEGSFPYTKLAARLLFSDVPEDEVRQMTSLSAAELYGLDLVALQRIADEIGPTVEEIATPVSVEELPAVSLGHTVAAAIARSQAAA
ncbi:MAG TPA: amidohydrolase family protein [Acidimicrobiales bacterium]